MVAEKTLTHKDMHDVNELNKHRGGRDIESVNNPGRWKLVCKASSKSEGWMKTTKSLEIEGVGCLVQTETQQRNVDQTNSVSQALVFVPGATNKQLGVLERL